MGKWARDSEAMFVPKKQQLEDLKLIIRQLKIQGMQQLRLKQRQQLNHLQRESKMKARSVGGNVEERKALVHGVATKACVVDKVGQEMAVTEMLEAAITINVVRHQKILQLTLTRALTLRMKERIVGGVVDERKESVLGVEKMECAVEEDG